ncbi:MAG: dihydrolipoyllysine-residue succinyltransferase [Acidobacterium sp.]|nr:2-oxoglutarate dehydrogenase complex dihydrolipoyllysine-residue succinyltransferase [Acidobacteriota bacterium]PHY11490.1 MAG: dihydrolipoyllysine-residue succinyltransferase [Acidobacterium sp.]
MATNIVVPELGESVVEARVAKWLKKAGDSVVAGDALVELETEKIDLEVSADRAGVLGEIKHQEGADVKVGEVLAILEDALAGTVPEVPKVPKVQEPQAAEKKATPTAKNVARAHDVSIESVPAAGARVTKQDVLKAAAPAPVAAPEVSKAPSPKAPAGDRSETRERMSKRRATIARRLVEAQHTAAMLTTFNEVDMSALMALRERRKDAFLKKHGVGVGIASFFVQAAIGALKAFPQINAEIQGDEIVYKHYYDIGMAVGAEGGLVVPVLRDADRMGFAGIELGIRDVAARAKNGTLTLEDLKGGTFTITNGGVFGSLMSTPILNPPQVGILGLHKIADRVVPVNGQIVIRPMMYLALSYDHRLVDGREAVQFLVKIKEYIEDPAWMLLDA